MIDYVVFPCSRKEIRRFIEKWHYSSSIDGVMDSYCFKLMENTMIGQFRNSRIIGAALFGNLAMAGVWEKYADAREKVTELRRLCCIDDTPKNTESYFISRCLKWLKHNSPVDVVISYADENHGHFGGIYRASNFEYLGTTSPSRAIEWNGKLWHDKAIRTTYRGRLKPYARKLKEALERGDAQYVDTKVKHIYLYRVRGRKPRNSLFTNKGEERSL